MEGSSSIGGMSPSSVQFCFVCSEADIHFLKIQIPLLNVISGQVKRTIILKLMLKNFSGVPI